MNKIGVFVFAQFRNYQAAVTYLIHELPKTTREVFDDDSTLAKNRAIVGAIGKTKKKHSSIHVAGTSGKGSVCYLIDAILRAHSKRTGMIQSPHIYDIRERIQVNGQLISEKKFVKALNVATSSIEAAGIRASYFEVLTAMAFYTFGHTKIDYQILETGLGGRLDATNVVQRQNKLCVLMQIGLDHMHALGDTLEAIAQEKAGIVQPGNTVIALRQDPTVNAVFEARCREQNARLIWVEQENLYLRTNDSIALAVCRTLANRDGWVFDEAIAHATLQQVFIPGRYEKRHLRDHLVILDGAHNPQKLSALASKLKIDEKFPATFVLAIADRKDIASCLRALASVAERIIATEFFTHEQDIPRRPIAANQIASLCKELGIPAIAESDPKKALELATSYAEPIVITGSFYLIGEVDSLF